MTPDGLPRATANTAPATVPHELSPALPMPHPVRRVPFLRAFLLFWVLPRRYGPHLASGSLRRAAGAHLLALVLLVPIVVWTASGRYLGHAPSVQECRACAAYAVVQLAAVTTRTSQGALVLLGTIVAIPALELTWVLLAVLLMPWCAGGDAPRTLFRRSLAHAWWCTTVLIPAGVILGLALVYEEHASLWLRRREPLLLGAATLLVLALPTVLVLRAMLSGASRYVGPASGPGFEPRQPRCDSCGYPIVGLPLGSACPECGRAIRDSARQGPRADLLPVDTHQAILRGLLLQVLVPLCPKFFRRVHAYGQYAASRRLWWTTFLLQLLAVATVLRLLAENLTMTGVVQTILPAMTLFIILPIALQMVIVALACLWGFVRHGIRDWQVSASVGFACAPASWLLVPVGIALTALAIDPIRQEVVELFRIQQYWPAASLDILLGILLYPVGGLGVLLWWLRVCRGLRDVRYANA